MDWIVAAGEPGQQDRHAKALIRVANSDLILDEVDSFDVKATVAVMRVVQVAAMFGRNVIVSSATLNAALAEGLCLAYAKGREIHDAMFGKRPWHLTMVSDQFDPGSLTNPTTHDAGQFYRKVMNDAAQRLRGAPPLRRYRLADAPNEDAMLTVIAEQANTLHKGNAFTPNGLPCRVSIGLIRVANIGPCMEIAEHLRADGRFFVTAYHAQDVAQRRAWRERMLDRILDRRDDKWIDALCEEFPDLVDRTGDLRLIVVATPVEEVGRDHDFDWAIIEPSSMHSIIQTAGRVNRHRRRPLDDGKRNVCILQRNMRGLRVEPIAFTMPGLEIKDGNSDSGATTHPSHDMSKMLSPVADWPRPNAAIDAGLVFDDGGRKTLFAQCDENAVSLQIARARPVLERANGYQTHFMFDSFAAEYPLRDSPRRTEYGLDLVEGKFHLIGTEDEKAGRLDIRPVPQSGVWLTPELNALAQDRPLRIGRTEYANKNGDCFPVETIRVHWHGAEFLHKGV